MRFRFLLPMVLFAACGAPQPKTRSGTDPGASAKPVAAEDTTVPEQHIDESPVVAGSALVLLDKGNQAAVAGDIAAARQAFEGAVRADPKCAEAHYNIGVLDERRGDYEQAERAYRAALDAREDFGPAVSAVASLLLRRGDRKMAKAFAKKALAKNKESNALRNAYGAVGLLLGENTKVIKDAKLVLRRDERNVWAMKNLGTAYYQQNKPELALAILRNAKELVADDPDIASRIALAHLALDEKHEARLALEEATNTPSGASAETYNNLGLLYHEAGDFAGAEAQFRKALERWPHMLAAQINLGNSLKGQQKYDAADAELRKALELDPKSAEALFNAGILYLDGDIPGVDKGERLNRAVDYFEQYKRNRQRPRSDDPVDDYLKEARKRIEVEKKRAEQMRRAQKSAAATSKLESGGEDDTPGAQPSDGVAEPAETSDAAPPPESTGGDGG